MPRYTYTARTRSGEAAQATAEVESLPALAAHLRNQGSELLAAREAAANVPRIRVPVFDVSALYRHLSESLEAGLPTVEALNMLSDDSTSLRFRSLVHFLKLRLEAGEPLSSAMALFPESFPPTHAAVVRAGEESGRLDTALAELAEQADGVVSMNRRLSSALVYPAVVALVALLIFNFGFFAIVPKFRALFGDLGIAEFNGITQFVFFLSGTALPALVTLVVGAALLITLISLQRKAARGRLWLDDWKLRIPVLGQIVEKAALARFTGMLGLLLNSGVDAPRAVRLAAGSTGSAAAERALRNVAVEIERGNTLSDSFGSNPTLPRTLAWRIGLGEETGALPETLRRMSRLYAGHFEQLVTSAAGLLEPVLIIIIGLGVALLVVGMFLPLMSIVSSLSGA